MAGLTIQEAYQRYLLQESEDSFVDFLVYDALCDLFLDEHNIDINQYLAVTQDSEGRTIFEVNVMLQDRGEFVNIFIYIIDPSYEDIVGGNTENIEVITPNTQQVFTFDRFLDALDAELKSNYNIPN